MSRRDLSPLFHDAVNSSVCIILLLESVMFLNKKGEKVRGRIEQLEYVAEPINRCHLRRTGSFIT